MRRELVDKSHVKLFLHVLVGVKASSPGPEPLHNMSCLSGLRDMAPKELVLSLSPTVYL